MGVTLTTCSHSMLLPQHSRTDTTHSNRDANAPRTPTVEYLTSVKSAEAVMSVFAPFFSSVTSS